MSSPFDINKLILSKEEYIKLLKNEKIHLSNRIIDLQNQLAYVENRWHDIDNELREIGE